MPDLFCENTDPTPTAQPDPDGWLKSLQILHDRLKPYFWSRDSWSRAGAYLVGLLSGAERKNSWQMGEEVGDKTPSGVPQR